MTPRLAASPTPSRPAFRAAVEASAVAEDAAGPPAIAAWSAHGAGVVVAPAVAGRIAGADGDERFPIIGNRSRPQVRPAGSPARPRRRGPAGPLP